MPYAVALQPIAFERTVAPINFFVETTLIANLLNLVRSGAKAPQQNRHITLSEIGPAEFIWHGASSGKTWHICIEFSTMRSTEDGSSEVELNIDHDGLRAQSVVIGSPDSTLVYLGNYFWVPEECKRSGLATGMVLALAQAAQCAAPMAAKDKPIKLEGFFTGEGALFAPAICVGKPCKGAPAALRQDVLDRARERLEMTKAPVVFRRW